MTHRDVLAEIAAAEQAAAAGGGGDEPPRHRPPVLVVGADDRSCRQLAGLLAAGQPAGAAPAPAAAAGGVEPNQRDGMQVDQTGLHHLPAERVASSAGMVASSAGMDGRRCNPVLTYHLL